MRTLLNIPLAILYLLAMIINLTARTIAIESLRVMEKLDKAISKEKT